MVSPSSGGQGKYISNLDPTSSLVQLKLENYSPCWILVLVYTTLLPSSKCFSVINQTWTKWPRHRCTPAATCWRTLAALPDPILRKWSSFSAQKWSSPWSWRLNRMPSIIRRRGYMEGDWAYPAFECSPRRNYLLHTWPSNSSCLSANRQPSQP